MKATTHVIGAIAIGYTILNNVDILNVNLSNEKVFTIVTAGLIFGGLLPDIDTQKSYISNKYKPAKYSVSLLLKHRGFTHSLIGAVSISILLGLLLNRFLSKYNSIIFMKSLCIGIISHIFLDMLNPQGICLFYPYKKRYSIGNFKIGGFGETILKFILLALAGYNGYYI